MKYPSSSHNRQLDLIDRFDKVQYMLIEIKENSDDEISSSTASRIFQMGSSKIDELPSKQGKKQKI